MFTVVRFGAVEKDPGVKLGVARAVFGLARINAGRRRMRYLCRKAALKCRSEQATLVIVSGLKDLAPQATDSGAASAKPSIAVRIFMITPPCW